MGLQITLNKLIFISNFYTNSTKFSTENESPKALITWSLNTIPKSYSHLMLITLFLLFIFLDW